MWCEETLFCDDRRCFVDGYRGASSASKEREFSVVGEEEIGGTAGTSRQMVGPSFDFCKSCR